jgi:two-component system, sensor histidine kinase YesM
MSPSGMSLRTKLFVMFLLLSTIPLISIGMFSYTLSSRIITEKEINENLIVLSQIDNQVSQFVGDKHVVSLSFLVDRNVQALIRDPGLSGAERKTIDFAIKAKLFDFHNLMGADSIVLALNGGPMYSNRSDLEGYFPRIEREGWFRSAMQRKARSFWGEPLVLGGETVIPFVQVLTTFSSLEPRGFLVINLRETYLQTLYTSFISSSAMSLFITSEPSIILTHPDHRAVGRSIRDLYGIASQQTPGESGSFIRRGGGHDDLVLYKKDPVVGMDFFSVTSLSVLLRNVFFIRRTTIVALFVMIALGLLTSLLLSQGFLSPMNRLIAVIRQIETSTLDNVVIPRLNGEIGLIALSFAGMVDKLRISLANEIRMEKEKREADLKVLEFQINPHFLYNTLSSVVWLSRENRNDDVIRVAKSLSNLFRISISKGKEIITIGEEIEHVKSYIEIEKIRHGDEFSVVYQLDPAITKNLTVKLVLQPLVENAIYHGIKQGGSGRGTITICGAPLGKDIRFQVIDDGGTLTEQEAARLNEILEHTSAPETNFGIGIRNVNDRVRLTYGSPYGLAFAKSGPLTVVSLLIPRTFGMDLT